MPDEIKQPTRRTDKQEFSVHGCYTCIVPSRFARQLETEPTASESRVADLEAKLAAVTKERDELQQVGKENDAAYLSAIGEITLLKKERDRLCQQLNVAIDERMDARSQCAGMKEEADRLRQRVKELERQKAEFRDSVLNGRFALEAVLDNDQTNAVLSNFDDIFSPESPEPTGTAATLEEGVEELERKGTRIDGRAALELSKIESVKSQLQHLQKEAEAGGAEYANKCNEKAQELIRILFKRKEGQP